MIDRDTVREYTEALTRGNVPNVTEIRWLLDSCGEALDEIENLRSRLTKPVLKVGDTVNGYCGGHFGNSYGNRTVTQIEHDFVILRGPADYGDPRHPLGELYVYRGDPSDLVPYANVDEADQ